VRKAIVAISALEEVSGTPVMIRVEDRKLKNKPS